MQSNGEVQKFSIFQNHYKLITNVPFKQITDAIINGYLKNQIVHIRQLIFEGKLEEAQKEKQKLEAFTASGRFNGKRNEVHLSSYSNLIILDFDNLNVDSLNVKIKKVQSMDLTYCSFLSPSGKGFKALIKVDSDKKYHKEAFNQVASLYEKELNIKIDRSGSDIARLCYVSYDPQLYFNERSAVFHVETNIKESNVGLISVANELDTNQKYRDAVNYTENVAKFKIKNRNNFIYTLAKNCNKRNISIEDAIAFITKDYGYDQKHDEGSIKSGYNQPIKEIIIKKTPVFSIDYLHTKRFKSEIKIDIRALFEVLLMKYLHFRKAFYYSRAAIQHDLGIKKDRAITIINYLKTIGFLDFEVRTTQLNGSPRQTTYFTVFPKNIPNVIDQLMDDGDEVKRRLKPLLDSDDSIDYG